MNRMSKKLNKKGFTLAELLIVVAIIAVLVVVSVPIFSSKLEKAREAADVANMRAAKAAAVSMYLEKGVSDEYFYDAEEGVLKTEKTGITGYGQGTGTSGGVSYAGYKNDQSYADQIIKVTIEAETNTSEPKITVDWDTKE